jgi:hypothetical protein
MARLDWDRLRRARPLDGADVRVDADGARVWEREGERARPPGDAVLPIGSRRLRRGVIVRRRQERANAEPVAAGEAVRTLRVDPIRCPRCGARVSPRKLLRHARRCPKPAP